VSWHWPCRSFTAPQFSVSALVSLALPLFVVTMASQNLPGVAAQRAAGLRHAGVPAHHADRPGHAGAGAVWCFALNLSAITAAICMGREAHEDPKKRYTAAVSCGADLHA
jgi:benzoate membrane transport protein